MPVAIEEGLQDLDPFVCRRELLPTLKVIQVPMPRAVWLASRRNGRMAIGRGAAASGRPPSGKASPAAASASIRRRLSVCVFMA